jgi:hypothetical protein
MENVHWSLEVLLCVSVTQIVGFVQNRGQVWRFDFPKVACHIGGKGFFGGLGEAWCQTLTSIPVKEAGLQLKRVLKLETNQHRKWGSRVQVRQSLVCSIRIVLSNVNGEKEGSLCKVVHFQSPCRSSIVPQAIKSSILSQSACVKTGPSLKIAFRRAAKSGLFGGFSGLSGTILAKGFPRRVTRTSSPAASQAAIFGK